MELSAFEARLAINGDFDLFEESEDEVVVVVELEEEEDDEEIDR